jgi:hypothetical protein
MNRQKDTKTRVFAQKLMDDYLKRRRDSQEDWLIEHDDFLKYPNKELFEYLETDYAELTKILEDLKSRGVIFQYECLDTEDAVEKSKKAGLENYRTTGFSVDRMPRHEECVIKIADYFIDKIEAYLAGQSDPTKIVSSGKIVLHLDKSGNLWYGDDKGKNCYSMKTDGQVFFIFNYLVDNSGVQPTKDIARAVSSAFSITKTSRQVSVDIGRIKRKISGKIKVIKGEDLIPKNKNGDGYRISSRFQIIEL